MRIVLMYLGRKGAGPIYSLEFTRALLEQGNEVMGIISQNSANGNDWDLLEDEYGKNGQLQLMKVKTFKSTFQFLLRTLNIFIFYHIIVSVKRFHPDVALATMIHPWHEIIFSLLKNKVLRFKVIHDVTPHAGENSIFKRILSKLDILISDKWIVLTQNSKDKLQKKGVPVDKIFVIPHAHFGFYNKYNSFTGKHNISNRIGFFGRICKYKGIENLLQSYCEVVKKLPQLKLLIAGSGKFDYETIAGVELYNRWINDDEVVSLLSGVDVVVLPYIEASQSGVIPLAFSLGKPVIVTNVGGLSEQVPSDCGILVPSNDVNALSESILYLYAHPDEIKKMGECAYKYAYDNLDWKRSAAIFISLIGQNKL